MKDRHEFEGVIGKQYSSSRGACPNHDRLQYLIGKAVSDYFPEDGGEGKRVLDIGTGTGFTAKAVLEANPRIHVVCVEKEVTMLEQAREYLAKYIEEGRVTLVHLDILAFLDGYKGPLFDAIVQGYCFHNFERRYRWRVLQCIARVLRPGGIFVNGDKLSYDSTSYDLLVNTIEIVRFMISFSLERKFGLATEWLFHCVQDYRPHLRWKQAEARAQLTGLGFCVSEKNSFRKGVEIVFTVFKPVGKK